MTTFDLNLPVSTANAGQLNWAEVPGPSPDPHYLSYPGGVAELQFNAWGRSGLWMSLL